MSMTNLNTWESAVTPSATNILLILLKGISSEIIPNSLWITYKKSNEKPVFFKVDNEHDIINYLISFS